MRTTSYLELCIWGAFDYEVPLKDVILRVTGRGIGGNLRLASKAHGLILHSPDVHLIQIR